MMKSRMSDMENFVNFWSFQNSNLLDVSIMHKGISLKGLKTHLTVDQRTLTFFLGWSSKKSFWRSTDVLWFLETFSPLISFASFAAGRYILRYGHPKGDPGLRYGFRFPSLTTLSSFVSKSLFKTRKISDLKGFFGDHQKKKCQVRDLYVKTLPKFSVP